jgi:hypothetical protein
VQEGQKELQDAAAALKDSLVRNYGPVQESVDSSSGDAPQPEFLDH